MSDACICMHPDPVVRRARALSSAHACIVASCTRSRADGDVGIASAAAAAAAAAAATAAAASALLRLPSARLGERNVAAWRLLGDDVRAAVRAPVLAPVLAPKRGEGELTSSSWAESTSSSRAAAAAASVAEPKALVCGGEGGTGVP